MVVFHLSKIYDNMNLLAKFRNKNYIYLQEPEWSICQHSGKASDKQQAAEEQKCIQQQENSTYTENLSAQSQDSQW